MKKLLPFFTLLLLIKFSAQAQELNFRDSTYYYRFPGDTMLSSGKNLGQFNFSSADRVTDSIFHDGIYLPASDCFGRNLWIRIRHIAEDPNGTSVGINITATASNPCQSNIMIGGWAGFLYDFEIHRDINLTGKRGNFLGALYPTSITVASLETLSGDCGNSEWLSFVVVNSGSTGWSLNSTNFTGINLNSKPAFSDTLAVYTTGGCYPPDGFHYAFPEGADSISAVNGNNVGYSEFKMSAGSVSHFRYGYEYSGGAGGYQGMSMAFGSPPTYSVKADSVSCRHGNNGEIHVTINGGIGPFTYQWSDSTASGDSLKGLSAGTYHLTVTDQNGCGKIADTTFIISEPVNVSVSLDSTTLVNVQCPHGTDASIQLFASGNAPITYHWNTNATDSLLTGLKAGIYTATISDLNSCWVTRDTLVELTTINTSTTVAGDTITAIETGATYQWLNCSDNSMIVDETSFFIIMPVAGSYKVAITKNGCTDTSACETITGIEESSFGAVRVYPNPATNELFISDAGNQTGHLIIYNVNGEKIKDQSYNHRLDVSSLLPGIYFLDVMNNDIVTKHGRFVKQ